MNVLDLFVAAIVLAAAVHGFITGAIKQVAGFVSLILAFVLGLSLMESVGSAASGILGITPALAPFAGFIIVFLVVQLTVVIIVKMVEKIIGALKLSGLNRLAGSGIGVAKGALALSVAFMAFGYVGIPSDQVQEQSLLYEPVSEVLPAVWGVIGGWSSVRDLEDVFRQNPVETPATE
ncbi:MAG: CvpA family protein [Rhodothermales bacterium]|nr:CvpA family protein [Rhodothermales bacterium]